MKRSTWLLASLAVYCFSCAAELGDAELDGVSEDELVGVVTEPLRVEDGATLFLQNSRTKPEPRCIGVDQASTAAGALIKQFKCDRSKNQTWIANPRQPGSGFYEFQNSKDRRMCMGVDGGSTASGAKLMLFACDGSRNQTWFFREAGGDRVVTIRNGTSSDGNRCIGVDNGSTANGAQLMQFTCDGKPNQSWLLPQ